MIEIYKYICKCPNCDYEKKEFESKEINSLSLIEEKKYPNCNNNLEISSTVKKRSIDIKKFKKH